MRHAFFFVVRGSDSKSSNFIAILISDIFIKASAAPYVLQAVDTELIWCK